MLKKLKTHRFIILLLTAIFILRLPSLFEPYWYGDEGIYLSIGMALRKGLLLYRDIFDNKTPFIYLLAAIVDGNQFWFRALLSASVLSSIYLFYQLCLIFFNKENPKTWLATILFAVLTTLRILEGNIANAELFILLPTLAGVYLFFKNEAKKKPAIYLLSGLLFSFGFLFKATSLMDFIPPLIFLTFFSGKKLVSLKKDHFFLIAGFFVPIIITFFFFWTKGTFSEFFNSCFVQMFGYVSSWETGSHSFSLMGLLKSELVIKSFILLALTFLTLFTGKQLPASTTFSFLWFSFGLFAVVLPGRPYPHYLVQIVPPFCLMIVQINQIKFKQILFPVLAVFLLAFSLFHYQFWYYPTIPYYQNFISFLSGKKNKTEYFKFFNPSLPAIYETAEITASLSSPSDKIFIWATEPDIYVLSRRLPATPYLVAYHILDLNFAQTTINKIYQDPPKIIIIDSNTKSFPQLEVFIKENYIKIKSIQNFSIFRITERLIQNN